MADDEATLLCGVNILLVRLVIFDGDFRKRNDTGYSDFLQVKKVRGGMEG
jgi:hypothetical protein